MSLCRWLSNLKLACLKWNYVPSPRKFMEYRMSISCWVKGSARLSLLSLSCCLYSFHLDSNTSRECLNPLSSIILTVKLFSSKERLMLHWTDLRMSGSYWSLFCLFAVLKKTGPSRHPGGISQKFRVSFLLCSQLTTLFTSVIVFLKVIGFCIFITKSSLECSDPIISSDSPSQYFSTSLSHLELFCRTFLYRICLQFKTSSASQKIRGTPIEKCKGVPGRCNKLFGVIKGEVLGKIQDVW